MSTQAQQNNDMTDEQLEAATAPGGTITPKEGEKPPEGATVDVKALADQAGKPEQPHQTVTSGGQPHQKKDDRNKHQQHQSRQPRPEPSVGNKIKGLETLANGQSGEVLKAEFEAKKAEAELALFRERTTFAKDLARIFNVDRDFAKRLLALSEGR